MTKAKSKPKAAARATKRKTDNPKSRVRSTPASLKTTAKPDTKHTRIVAMLRSPGGATIAAIMTAKLDRSFGRPACKVLPVLL
jgi:hypothetical protein